MLPVLPLLLIFIAPAAQAYELHYFGSANFTRTNIEEDIVVNEVENRWRSSPLITAGANVSTKVDEKSSALIQAIHTTSGNVRIDLLQYQRTFPKDFTIRLGRQRLPLFLMSEVVQVQALLPWAAVPAEVYNKNPLRSFSGVSIEKALGDFRLHLWGGDTKEEFNINGIEGEASATQNFGVRLNYAKGDFQSFAVYSKEKVNLKFSTPVEISTGVYGDAIFNETYPNLEHYVAGMSYAPESWLFMTEYILGKSPNSAFRHDEAAYVTLGRDLTEKLMILATYSTDIHRRSDFLPSQQTSYTLSTRYKLDHNIVLKAGVTHVNFRGKDVVGPSGVPTDGYFGYSDGPEENYQIFDTQIAFVF